MADERVFKITINGIEESYKNAQRLVDVLNLMNDVNVKVAASNKNSEKVSKEKTKALTDEEKAQSKLAETQAKASKEITALEKEQAKANLQLRERAKYLNNLVKLEQAAKNSPAEFKAELALLNQEWDKVNVGTKEFEELTERIDDLTSKLKEAEAAKGTFTRNVGNYPKELESVNQSFNKLGKGVQQTTEATKGMLSTFQAGIGLAVIFGDGNSKLEKILSNVGKVATTVGLIQQANNTLIKNGAVAQIAYNLQNKVRIGLDALVTRGIISQSAAQTALNIATKAFPLLAIIGGITALVSLLSSARDKTESYKSAIDGMNFSTKEAADKHDDFLKRIRDIQIEIDIATGKITEYQASLMRISNRTVEAVEDEKKRLVKELQDIDKEYDVFYKKLGKSFTNYVTGQDEKVSLEALEKERLDRRNKAVESSTQAMTDIYALSYAEQRKETTLNNIKEKKEQESQTARLTDEAKTRVEKLRSLRIEQNKIQLELTREVEDVETGLISDEFDRREKTIQQYYSRRKEDLERRLTEDEKLTKESVESINELIKYLGDQELADFKKLQDDKLAKQRETWSKIKELNNENLEKELKENEDAYQKITLEQTRQLENRAIDRQEYEDRFLANTISSLQKEISIRKKYGQDTTDLEIELSQKRIDQAEKERDRVTDYFEQMHAKLQEIVNNLMTAVDSIFSGINTVIDSQLEDANSKYEAISQKYDEVVEKREESDSKLQDLEEQAKNERGGRAIVLQAQINAEMQANQQLANQEKQLAKDKEKQEQEIAKKEKQQKKVELAQNIVQGLANTALGVTRALTWGFPLGTIYAGIIGAMGALQVGYMTAQLTKLEDGGQLKGKRHSQGGMRIEGTNIEVEGGEYVVNRESTSKNLGLIRYINTTRKELTPDDINSYFSTPKGSEPPFKKMFEAGGQLPNIENTVTVDNGAIVDAIESMEIEPRVSVVDINTVQKEVTSVDDWTGL